MSKEINKQETLEQVFAILSGTGLASTMWWRENIHRIKFPDGVGMSWDWIIESDYYKSFILTPEFAKKLWGDETWEGWLQLLVMEEDPLAFLGRIFEKSPLPLRAKETK